MVNGLIGKKIGMTQVLKADGTMVPVTIVQAMGSRRREPCGVRDAGPAEKTF